MEDEAAFMSESLELHYNIAELLGTILRTHCFAFLPIFRRDWDELMLSMTHEYCLREDRQFGYFIISDLIEYVCAYTQESAPKETASYLNTLVERLYAGSVAPEAGVRQTCVYAMGVAAEKIPLAILPHAGKCLSYLSQCVSMGDGEGGPRGTAADNAVSAVGFVLEALSSHPIAASQLHGDAFMQSLEALWSHWLNYLPLVDDQVRWHAHTSRSPPLPHKSDGVGIYAGGMSASVVSARADACGMACLSNFRDWVSSRRHVARHRGQARPGHRTLGAGNVRDGALAK